MNEFREDMDMTEEANTSNDDICPDIPEDIPEDVSAGIAEKIPDDIPDDIPEDIPEVDTPDGTDDVEHLDNHARQISDSTDLKERNDLEEMLGAGEMLEKFGISKAKNGSDYFVHGDHFEQFEWEYNSPEESEYVAYDIPVEKEISPGLIEGIHLGKGEAENPEIFWRNHEKDGTAESFQEIASHIPEVRDKLTGGATLQELSEDPELAACAGIYFANKPEVVENDGYFEFDSNGRHRILAARALGYDIPVKVVGKRYRNNNAER